MLKCSTRIGSERNPRVRSISHLCLEVGTSGLTKPRIVNSRAIADWRLEGGVKVTATGEAVTDVGLHPELVGSELGTLVASHR